MHQNYEDITNYLASKRAAVATARSQEVDKILQQRIISTNCDGPVEYLQCIKENDAELQSPLDVLTNNVSKFFRNPLVFELLAREILLPMIFEKSRRGEALRLWSAGCAQGEEAYSLAIILHELLLETRTSIQSHIFATDIDNEALNDARTGRFGFDRLTNTKAGLLRKYFSSEDGVYQLQNTIKNRVSFSSYDLLDDTTVVPPMSIYGNFDLVLCRNLIIYYDRQLQNEIIKKVDNSLSINGFLVLGDAESLSGPMAKKYVRRYSCVYQKMQ